MIGVKFWPLMMSMMLGCVCVCPPLATQQVARSLIGKKQRGEGGNFLGFREQMELRIEEQNTEFDGCSCI